MSFIVVCGQPASGKSTVVAKLAALLRAGGSEVVVVDEPGLHLLRDEAYKDTVSEKNTRGKLKSAAERATNKRNVVILDSINNIKGYRYELWCVARASGCKYCMVHVDTNVAQCQAWNDARIDGDKYCARVFDDLAGRFERPDARARWDAPLFTVRPEEVAALEVVTKVVAADRTESHGAPQPGAASGGGGCSGGCGGDDVGAGAGTGARGVEDGGEEVDGVARVAALLGRHALGGRPGYDGGEGGDGAGAHVGGAGACGDGSGGGDSASAGAGASCGAGVDAGAGAGAGAGADAGGGASGAAGPRPGPSDDSLGGGDIDAARDDETSEREGDVLCAVVALMGGAGGGKGGGSRAAKGGAAAREGGGGGPGAGQSGDAGGGASSSGRQEPQARLEPSFATSASPLSGTNTLSEIDRAAQDVVDAVVAACECAGAGCAPGIVRVAGPGGGESLSLTLEAPVTLAELRRHKRAFLKLATKMLFARVSDADTARRMFVDYLRSNISQGC
ncbi:hypothetical protein FOA52_007503 [Chlamydomonas sp. UWO 241]|nr:hypothetical protein FOA52_007503 [Chlamydomonas sp. UWO 241]